MNCRWLSLATAFWSKKSTVPKRPARISIRLRRELGGQGEGSPGGGHPLVAQGDDLPDEDPRQVGGGAQRGVAHHVQVGEAGQAERVAQPRAARALHVDEQLGRVGLTRMPVYSVATYEVRPSGRGMRLFGPSYGESNEGWPWKMTLSWPDTQNGVSSGWSNTESRGSSAAATAAQRSTPTAAGRDVTGAGRLDRSGGWRETSFRQHAARASHRTASGSRESATACASAHHRGRSSEPPRKPTWPPRGVRTQCRNGPGSAGGRVRPGNHRVVLGADAEHRPADGAQHRSRRGPGVVVGRVAIAVARRGEGIVEGPQRPRRSHCPGIEAALRMGAQLGQRLPA